jgi:hypothetical protein
MLRATKEFSEFGDFGDSTNGMITFLKLDGYFSTLDLEWMKKCNLCNRHVWLKKLMEDKLLDER